ncbi:Uncharacterised protein [Legionella lansingensis]|uniref:Uncharacterized protein n=1 Tax=Legionella lansingensis TaxID=45067 RepID=A0A0W0VGX1_9GAMM|nr:hypothetical protein [Legionella lansingensis]KTD19343.1 hypothetical protein Llan_2081 [Legionella lansingensis]SNV52930.1 Uncharacterised protein [Legionella lansingensis]
MKPIVFFTDTGKDGDDLIATVHVILQAKSAGIIPLDTSIILVTADEIPANEKGIQDPNGQYGLRAQYLTMQLAKLKEEVPLPAGTFPQVIAGPRTTYYRYSEEKKAFSHEASGSEAFYLNNEVQTYFADKDCDNFSCTLSPIEEPLAWLETLKPMIFQEGATFISIAAFDAIGDVLKLIPGQHQENFSVITMGYNRPYSAEEYQQKTNDPNRLPYNARTTDPQKALQAITTLTELPHSFHVVSGTTRTLPKYDANSWLASFIEITSRAYPIYAGHYAKSLLISMIEFIKNSKYKGFWPHDVVASLMMLLEQGQWEKLGLPKLNREMLFTEVESLDAQRIRLRMIGNTGVLLDSTVPAEENDQAVSTENHAFTYGKELDVVFFSSLLHLLALEALPTTQKQELKILPYYKKIVELKARLFDSNNPEVKIALAQEIQINWNLVCLMELQQQLALQTQVKATESQELTAEYKLNLPDISYVLGSQGTAEFTLAKFSEGQAKFLYDLVTMVVNSASQNEASRSFLGEQVLKWLKDFAEIIQKLNIELEDYYLPYFTDAWAEASRNKTINPLTSFMYNCLRASMIPERVCDLLEQNGKLGVEFKRTGNSLLYAYEATIKDNLSIPFPEGVRGMSPAYKALLSLTQHSISNKLAFLFHLAIHDAGKGDTIKNAVKLHPGGFYMVKLEDSYYYIVKMNDGYFQYQTPNTLPEIDERIFKEANRHVDHDDALEIYARVGSMVANCSPTEFLLYGEVIDEELREDTRDAIALCDELISLCNEINIAQIVQGEIPFAGIKKGLDRFFEAYKQDPLKAELIFAHHCYDIFGAAPLDSLASVTAGNSKEIHLKINLLYETLLEVAEEDLGKEVSATAYHRYREKLAHAIPAILKSEDTPESSVVLAKTRLAQMLRCHLFKTRTDESEQMSIAEDGAYESRTTLFVESIDAAFQLLDHESQEKLVECLNRNIDSSGRPSVMLMYGPKLLLTATTGSEFAANDPTNKTKIAECLAPMLDLYTELYNLQAKKSAEYSFMDVGDLAKIVEKVFNWYKDASLQQKNCFASMLACLQATGRAEAFLNGLGDIKTQSSENQLAQIKECLSKTNLPFTVSEAGLVAVKLPDVEPVDDKVSESKPNPIEEIIKVIHSQNTKAKKQQVLLTHVREKNLSVEELNELYHQVKHIDALNTHRNPRWDNFFGVKNTASWRDTLAQFRKVALETLFAEVEYEEDRAEKLSKLETAKKMPLFAEHRNNSILTGAWGRTTAVRRIEEEEDVLYDAPVLE